MALDVKEFPLDEEIGDEEKITKFGLLLKRFCNNLNADGFLYRFDLVSDCGEFGPKWAFKNLTRHIWRVVTFASFRRKVGQVFDYAKRGWNTEDFDYSYVLEDFCWKLDRLADHIEEHDMHTTAQADAKKIRRTIKLFKRALDDDYLTHTFKDIDEKYGKKVFDWSPEEKEDGKPQLYRLKTSRPKAKPEDEKLVRDLEIRAYKLSDRARARDFRYALKSIEKHFWAWWC